MRVLVTGGAGFIGSHLVRSLRALDREVRVFDDLSAGKRGNVPGDVEFVCASVLDVRAVRAALQDVDVVVHLAAVPIVDETRDGWHHMRQVNVVGALNVFREAAKTERSCRVVFASSAAVYGEAGDTPLTEDGPALPISSYGVDKLANERYADVIGRTLGLKWAGFRMFNVFGPGQDPASPYSGVVSKFLERARGGQDLHIFGDGTQIRDFVFVGDVVDVFLWALRTDDLHSTVLNVGTGRGMSVNDLAAAIMTACASPGRIVHQAPRAGDIRTSIADNSKLAGLGGPLPKTTFEAGLKAILQRVDG